MVSRHTRTRGWNNRGSDNNMALWFWGFVAAALALILALMFVSKDMPADTSFQLMSNDMMMIQSGNTSIELAQ